MFRRVMIGLWMLGGIALLATDANAGCASIGGKRVCASYITGGSEIGIVTAEGYAPNNAACPAVFTTQSGCTPGDCECNNTCGGGDGDGGGTGDGGGIGLASFSTAATAPAAAVTLRLVGTVDTVPGDGLGCGLSATNDQTCDIRGVVFCGDGGDSKPKHGDKHEGKHTGHSNSGRRNAVTDGPLTVDAPGFAQVDPTASGGDGRHFAGFRFQINPLEQANLCNVATEGEFRTFVALEGFFEACVVPPTNFFCDSTDPMAEPCVCVREFCTVGPPSSPDDVQKYQCRPV
jgi:hypothetical protein